MNLSRRDLLTATLAGVPALMAVSNEASAQAPEATDKAGAAAPRAPGALTEESLETLLGALGLKPAKTDSRFDFTFASKVQEEEWALSMSAVLSADQNYLWIMAWLDELPRSARDVPRTALLRLLAENDRLGKARFFSYIPANRRFTLQQVVENREMSSKKFRALLVELGQVVALTYPYWSVNAWKESDGADSDADDAAQQPPIQHTGASAPTRKTGARTAKPATARGTKARKSR